VANKAKAKPPVAITVKPRDHKGDAKVRVVIETPKGCRNKYKYDPDLASYKLSKVLPEGMVFPFDFGFVPRTVADDGDPIDVLLLMDEPAFPGCVVEARLIGVIEGEQSEDGNTERNDRLIAVAEKNHGFADLQNVSELPPTLLNDIRQFFVNYNQLRGREFKPLGTRGPKQAMRLLEEAMKRAKAA
jgi:inorganic pyrophosphatase